MKIIEENKRMKIQKATLYRAREQAALDKFFKDKRISENNSMRLYKSNLVEVKERMENRYSSKPRLSNRVSNLGSFRNFSKTDLNHQSSQKQIVYNSGNSITVRPNSIFINTMIMEDEGSPMPKRFDSKLKNIQ